jgi:hypothetical protein
MTNIIKILSDDELFNQIVDTLNLKEKQIKVNPVLAILSESILTILNKQLPIEEKVKRTFSMYSFLKSFSKENNLQASLEVEKILDILKVISSVYEETRKRKFNNNRKYSRTRNSIAV